MSITFIVPGCVGPALCLDWDEGDGGGGMSKDDVDWTRSGYGLHPKGASAAYMNSLLGGDTVVFSSMPEKTTITHIGYHVPNDDGCTDHIITEDTFRDGVAAMIEQRYGSPADQLRSALAVMGIEVDG